MAVALLSSSSFGKFGWVANLHPSHLVASRPIISCPSNSFMYLWSICQLFLFSFVTTNGRITWGNSGGESGIFFSLFPDWQTQAFPPYVTHTTLQIWLFSLTFSFFLDQQQIYLAIFLSPLLPFGVHSMLLFSESIVFCVIWNTRQCPRIELMSTNW